MYKPGKSFIYIALSVVERVLLLSYFLKCNAIDYYHFSHLGCYSHKDEKRSDRNSNNVNFSSNYQYFLACIGKPYNCALAKNIAKCRIAVLSNLFFLNISKDLKLTMKADVVSAYCGHARVTLITHRRKRSLDMIETILGVSEVAKWI